MIYLISGNGRGAGKTTLAHRLVGEKNTFSHAQELRVQLARKYSSLPWFATDQVTKDRPRTELDGRSMREVMVEYGQEMCRKNTLDYWARIVGWTVLGILAVEERCAPVAVDDVRKVVELEVLRGALSEIEPILHFHVSYPGAIHEPEFQAAELEAMADYVIHRRN